MKNTASKLTADQLAALKDLAAQEHAVGLNLKDKALTAYASLVRKGFATREDVKKVPATLVYTSRADCYTLRGTLRTVTLCRYLLTPAGREELTRHE